MEECLPICSLPESEILHLKKKLELLHSYQVIHMDIKPDNISYSPSRK